MTGLTSIGTGSLTATGDVTAASFKVGGKTYVSSTGLNANGQKITNVADGDISSADSKDAVNGGQLYTALQGVKGTTYADGDGITITGADNKISVNTGKGLEIADDKVQVKVNGSNLTLDDTNGLSLSTTLTGLTSIGTGSLTATGDVTAASFKVDDKTYISSTGLNANGQKITNVADGDISSADSKDAVNGGQLYTALQGVKGTTYADGDGITIAGADNKISVNTGKGLEIADDKVQVKVNGSNLTLDDTNGLSLSTTLTGLTSIGTGSLTATGDVTAASFKVDDKTYISSTGLNANSQKITNVGEGTVGETSTDAVNGSQLYEVQQSIKTYTDGDGITIDAADGNKISVNAGNGITVADDLVTVNTGKGLTFDADDENSLKVAIGEGLGFDPSNQVKVNVGNGLTIDTTDGANDVAVKISGDNLIFDAQNDNALSLSTTLKGLESIEASDLIKAGSMTAGNIVINGSNNGKITGLTEGEISDKSTDAVTGSQLYDIKQVSDLAVTYTNQNKLAVELEYNSGKGTTINYVSDGELSEDSMDAVNGRQLHATNLIVGDGQYGSRHHITQNGVNMNLTDAVSALDFTIGDLKFIGKYALSAQETTVTGAMGKLDAIVGTGDFTGLNTPYLNREYTLTTATDKLATIISGINAKVGLTSIGDDGTVGSISWDDSSITPTQTVIGAIKEVSGRVDTLEAIHDINTNALSKISGFSNANLSTLSALSDMDMSAVNTLSSLSADDLSKLSEISVASDGSGAAETSGTNTTNNSGRPDRGPGSGADDSISHDGDTVTVDNNVKVTGDTDLQGNLNVDGDTTLGGKLEVGGDATFNGNVDMNGTLNMNGNKITGVADGDISADSTDAVNGSQLWQTNQQVAANTENIGILGSAVNKLGDRIERVGAGAAALAALHPLDFDPDNKLDFAAGFGNYRGASAVAVGAFYRPSENVMFSVGGAFGGGEDMVNAGVSFKVGAGSGSATTSRTAMAKSLKSMQEVVASQDAQLAQQREQIDKLTAMVELLMEQNGQAQPKDGDAQAAQPQQ